MEVLSKLLAKCIEVSLSFKYHWKCDKIKLSHLYFADDLIRLCHGSLSSALVLKTALDEFFMLSGSMLIILRATSSLPVSLLSLANILSTSLVTQLVLSPFVISTFLLSLLSYAPAIALPCGQSLCKTYFLAESWPFLCCVYSSLSRF
ncbi:hypothetical protein Dsin_024664 [Dipteronia sinensis]|uniref:Reverse transcriptase domain-containing protein n=1 Tax=Dipteronia sinensis TaxID=43782 RepID=A0AAE0DXL5_9ROSI|nr:hypothetical protein Dsin_024664 [Dipteronia sinensis]